jgi:tRNA(fMet)-specific endonuclease VapC
LISPNALTKSRIICDTDVVSYIFNGHTTAKNFEPYLSGKTLAVSFMTVAQLFYGAYKAGWGNNRITKLQNHLKGYVVLPYDYEICYTWAQINVDVEKLGYRMESGDCWIAASALRHDCALATNNGKHFQYVDALALICPNLV